MCERADVCRLVCEVSVIRSVDRLLTTTYQFRSFVHSCLVAWGPPSVEAECDIVLVALPLLGGRTGSLDGLASCDSSVYVGHPSQSRTDQGMKEPIGRRHGHAMRACRREDGSPIASTARDWQGCPTRKWAAAPSSAVVSGGRRDLIAADPVSTLGAF